MTITGKSLGEGRLPATRTFLYTVPVGKYTVVRFWSAHNRGGLTETVEFWANKRQICRAVLQPNEQVRVLEDEEIHMAANENLEGMSTNANNVDYVIQGVERTL